MHAMSSHQNLVAGVVGLSIGLLILLYGIFGRRDSQHRNILKNLFSIEEIRTPLWWRLNSIMLALIAIYQGLVSLWASSHVITYHQEDITHGIFLILLLCWGAWRTYMQRKEPGMSMLAQFYIVVGTLIVIAVSTFLMVKYVH